MDDPTAVSDSARALPTARDTTNGTSFIFPLWGIALSAARVLSGTFDVYG